MKYALIDLQNVFFRSRHVTKGSIDLRLGLTLNIFFNSLLYIENNFEPDHYVIAIDSSSWRRKVFSKYKESRRLQKSFKSQQEKEEDELFSETYCDLINFLSKTNVTLLKYDCLEADDLISGWTKRFKDSVNIIFSSDSDFIQLLENKNVYIYDPIKEIIINKEGIINNKNAIVEFSVSGNGKIKILGENNNFVPEENWFKWAKFLKIMKGDLGDGIFSAYPRVRKKDLRNAFLDMHNKGFFWNNLMQQTWIDHEGKKRLVQDCYKFNKLLVDLEELPEEIINKINSCIDNALNKNNNNRNMGFIFMKFCDKYKLKRVQDNIEKHLKYLSKQYLKEQK